MATRSDSAPGKSSSRRLHFILLRLVFISSFSGPRSSGVLRRLVRLLRLRLDPYVSWLLPFVFIVSPLFFSFGLRGSSFSSVLTSVFLEPARPSSSQRGHASAKGGCLRSQLHVDSRGKSSCLDFVFCLFLSLVPVSSLLVVSSLIVTVSLPGCFDLLQLARQSPAAAGQGEGRRHRVPG